MECAPKPDRLIRQCLAHVARGSHGALVFQWRASRGGAEFFHPALVPHAGPDSRAFRVAVHLGQILDRLSSLSLGTVEASAAILYDDESRWALQTDDRPRADVDYLGEVRAVHKSLWHLGITTDVIAKPRDHRLTVVPAHFIVDDELAAALKRYVERGGHLVVTFLTGVADEHLHVGLGGHPAKLRDVLGIRVEELSPPELVRLDGATRVGPNLTRHEYGRGVAWYSATRLDKTAIRMITEDAGVELADNGVEVVRRDGWLFVLNHTDEPRRVEHVTVAPGGVAVVQLDVEDGLVIQSDPAIG